MALQHSPSIVTDGLVLCLDAANPKSYPGSGLTCGDISSTVGLSTLQNGTSFSSQFGGRFIFDGTDDKIQVPSPFGDIDWASRAWSFSIWAKTEALGDRGMLTLNNTVGTNYGLVGLIGYGGFYWYFIKSDSTQSTYTTPYGPVTTNVPFNFVMTYNGQGVVPNNSTLGNISFYINGNGPIAPVAGGNASRGNLLYGIQLGAEIYKFDGDIYSFSMYDRVLTSTQVSQNFNALRGRFGI